MKFDRPYVGVMELANTEDLTRLADLSETLVRYLDPGSLASHTADELYEVLGLPLVLVAIHDGDANYPMKGVHGARHNRFREVEVSRGQGLGGQVMIEQRPVEVEDYVTDPRITNPLFIDVADSEGLGGLVAVPVEHDDELVGLLYGGVRSIGAIDDRAKALLSEAAQSVAPLMAASLRTSAAIAHRVDAERQRIASELHDDVGQLLFSISVSAQRLRTTGDEQLMSVAATIETQAREATQRMRRAFKVMAPRSASEALTVALQREVDELRTRSVVMAQFVTRGDVRALPPGAEAALIGAARQALFNVECHAAASLVVMTLHFEPTRVSLVIQDDGCGLPDDFELEVIPRGDHHWGLASVLSQAQRQGGTLDVSGGEDGGTVVRVSLPLEPADRAS